MTVLSEAAPGDVGMDPERITLIKTRLHEWMDGKVERGGVFLVARKGKIVLHEAIGPLTDKPDSPPMEKDSIFQVSSITKPVVATGIMRLVEEGLLGLNRPIKEYLPDVSGEGTDDVEVQHLLTHTSGFKEIECWAHFAEKVIKKKGVYEVGPDTAGDAYFELMKDAKSHFQPGSVMHYNNHNYALLLSIVERVSNMSGVDFFRQQLFEPLGMEDSSITRDRTKFNRQVVRGENVPAGRQPDNPLAGPEGTYMEDTPLGFSGLNTTALDLALFGQTLLNSGVSGNARVLSPAAVHEMTCDQIPGVPAEINEMRSAEASWGLGWAIQGNKRWPWYSSTLVPKGTFWHTGNGGSFFWMDKTNDLIGVYLSVTLILKDGPDGHIHWHGDLFQNMVTAAVVD